MFRKDKRSHRHVAIAQTQSRFGPTKDEEVVVGEQNSHRNPYYLRDDVGLAIGTHRSTNFCAPLGAMTKTSSRSNLRAARVSSRASVAVKARSSGKETPGVPIPQIAAEQETPMDEGGQPREAGTGARAWQPTGTAVIATTPVRRRIRFPPVNQCNREKRAVSRSQCGEMTACRHLPWAPGAAKTSIQSSTRSLESSPENIETRHLTHSLTRRRWGC